MKQTHKIMLWLAAGAVCGLAGAAQGQNALGNGHALDANLQAGTGGYNAPQATIDYAARNNVITGNVPGLSYFHGKSPYNSPNELDVTTGSDSFFRFNAESFPTSPTAQPYVTQGAPLAVFTSEAPTLAGQIKQLSVSNPVFLPRQAAPGPWTEAPIGRAWSALGGFAPKQLVLGEVQVPDGSLLQVNTSPYAGIGVENAGVGGKNVYQRATNYLQTQGAVTGLLDLGYSPMQGNPGAAPSQSPSQNGLLAPGLELGLELENGVRPNRPTDVRLPWDRRLAQIKAALFSPLSAQKVKPGEDVYLDLLRRIQYNQGVASGAQPVTPPPQPGGATAPPPSSIQTGVAPGSALPPQGAPGGTASPEALTPMPALSLPSPEQLLAARQARDQALRAAYGAAEAGGAAPGAPQSKSSSAQDMFSDNAAIPEPLASVVSTLRYNLPPLASLAGTGNDRVSAMLRTAEADMMDGRYFDAEAQYRLALQFSPDQPLIRIGQVNAQLGAGLARSAALNLRILFDEHPEIISTRYDARLLPRADRLERVCGELEEMARNTGRPEPALMLAYLGYQTHGPELIRYGLDLAQAAAPRDPLIRLVRRLWITPTPGETPATQAAPGTPLTPGSGVDESGAAK